MRFADSDFKPNSVIRLDQVRVGATRDARWDGLDGDHYDMRDVHIRRLHVARAAALERVGRQS